MEANSTAIFRTKESSTMNLSGYLLISLGLFMIPCIIVAMMYNDDITIMVIPMAIGLIMGTSLLLIYKPASNLRPPNALFMLGVLWAICFVFGAIPYYLSGMGLVDSFFESISGFSTAGATVIADSSERSFSLLFWRSITNWLGGIIIILIVMLLLPMIGFGSRGALTNEMSGSGSYNVSVKVKDAAVQFILMYVILSVLMWLILITLQVDPMEAITLVLATISTGGLANLSGDMTLPVKLIVIGFMFLGGTNFYLHYKAIMQRKIDCYSKNTEFISMTLWFFVASLVVFVILVTQYGGGVFEDYVDSLFMVISATTTTGFVCSDYQNWPSAAIVMVIAVSLIGASSGSTAGGIKVFRIVILMKYIRNTFSRILHPNNVMTITMDGAPLSKESVNSALVIITLFIFSIVFFTVLFMMYGLNALDSVTIVIGMITNFGLGIGEFGANGSFASLPAFLKCMCMLMMWMGRLEIITALAILSPKVWKEQYKDTMHARRERRESL